MIMVFFKGGINMSTAEHYFANLIHFDKDIPGEPNKKALPQEVVEAIDNCYYYLTNILFINREDLDEYLKKHQNFDRSEKGWWNNVHSKEE